jgi:tetratricopeptide (TPR) repeat protein
MDCCVRLNNLGASQLISGMYTNAVDSFTESLGFAKSAMALLAAENQVTHLKSCCSFPLQQQQKCTVVLFKESAASSVAPQVKGKPVVDHGDNIPLRGTYVSPLLLSECADYQLYEPTVEASIAIIFNLALAHHLSALHGPLNRPMSILKKAIALYELAYTVQMQEDAELSVEFTMAIVNNLGHIHRLLGDLEKTNQCFRHLLSTILLLRSYGGEYSDSSCYHNDTFVYSVSHLILRENAAGAA